MYYYAWCTVDNSEACPGRKNNDMPAEIVRFVNRTHMIALIQGRNLIMNDHYTKKMSRKDLRKHNNKDVTTEFWRN